MYDMYVCPYVSLCVGGGGSYEDCSRGRGGTLGGPFLKFTRPRPYEPGFRYFVNPKKREIEPVRRFETRTQNILHITPHCASEHPASGLRTLPHRSENAM